jgi:tetratricopeptide (TPR) repeat protein
MAPEQTRDSPDQLGPWTDLYLLGGTLYYLLTGQVPHPGGSGAAAFQSAMEGQVVPPTERRPERGVPEELSALTMGLLAPAPEDRQPATVAGFIEALQAYQSGVGRKRRSTAITEAVAARPTGVRDYGELNRQGNALTEAEALWPGNPAVEAERRRLLVEYTEVALSRKDLTLARFQAEQLPPGEPRRGLLARVQGAGDRQRARERQRRLALSGLAVLGLIVLLGSFQYLLAQRRANERLLAERDAAREARAESEGLMAFMLDDVWQGLLEIERVDLLEPVARRASEFYADRDPGDLGPEEQRNRGKMFRTVGDLLSYQGVNDEAAGAYGQADQIFRRLHAEQGDLDLLAQSLETRVQRGLALSDLGDKEGALAVLEGVQTEARAAREANPEDPVLKSLLADAIDVWGVVVYDQGDLPRAQEAFAQAVTLYGELLGQNPGPSATDAYQAASMRLAVVLNETGQSTAALAELDRTHGCFTDGTLLEALQRNSNLAFAASTRAEILNRLDRPQESVALLAVMAPDTAASLAQDPTNIEVRYRHLTVLSSLADSHQAAGSPAAARQRWEEVVRLVAAVEGESSLLYLDDLKVRALLHLGRVEEARPVAKALLARHWTHRGFQELVAEHGISP